MPLPSHSQSAARTPLNNLLGTEGSVRILRALTSTDIPLSASEIARRTELRVSGVTKSVAALIDTGIVERVGSGTRSPVRLRPDHPLTPALRSLFQRERANFEQVVERLRATAARLDPLPRAVWIEGAVAKGDDRFGDPIVVGVLASSGALDQLRETIERELEPLEQELDVAIEVRGRSAADVEAMSDDALEELRDVIPLLGPPPLSLSSRSPSRHASPDGPRTRSHLDADARAQALAAAIAERLRTDPSLVPRARAYVAKRLTNASAGERRELREWDRILRTMSAARLRRFLVDPGERATRLRQTIPFVGVLTAAEREKISAGIERDNAAD